MTVAIACEFDRGVLLCADTKITTGNEKRNDSKMYCQEWGVEKTGVTVFTFAGDVDYAAAAVEKCEQGIARLDFENTSLDEMQGVIEHVLAGFYQMHIYPHPARHEVAFNLLIGLRLFDQMRVLVTKETAVRRVYGYECVGAGGYLARYCLREALGTERAFDPEDLTLAEASLIVEHAINSAVEYDESCGYDEQPFRFSPEAEYFGMTLDGELGDIRRHIYLSDFPEKLRRHSWILLKEIAGQLDEAGHEAALAVFFDSVRKAHAPIRIKLEYDRLPPEIKHTPAERLDDV